MMSSARRRCRSGCVETVCWMFAAEKIAEIAFSGDVTRSYSTVARSKASPSVLAPRASISAIHSLVVRHHLG